jgi:hypothetical protein
MKSCVLEGRKTILIACETCLRMVKEIHGLKNEERIESGLSWNGIVFGEEKTFSGKVPTLRSSSSASPSPLMLKLPASVSLDETNSVASTSVNSAESNNSNRRASKKK